MPLHQTKWLTERPVLRSLIGGFALVVILLGLADVAAVRGTRAIEDDTSQVVREQLVMARLLNDVQAEQNTLAVVLHQMAHMPETINREALLRSLENADRALGRSARAASATAEAQEWKTLESTVREFSADVAKVIREQQQASPETLSRLIARHDEVVRLEQDLLDLSETRVAGTERSIEQESKKLAERSRWLLGACLALAVLCAVLTVAFARRSIRRIEWQSQELSRVSWHMLQGQEAAARRFSHELHDELGQGLAALKANLNVNRQEWETRRIDCLQLVDDAIANVRELSQLLRPVILDDFGLDAGLRWLTDRFGERTGIRTDYASTFHDRLPEEVETHLFRITQEALTNVARHSGATRVIVELFIEDNHVRLSIEDNGRGLSDAAGMTRSSLGMTGMRARAAQTGGELSISRPHDGGLRIDVVVPRTLQLEEHAVKQEDPHPVSG
jgi:signal transduction histidine kinase